MYVSGICSMAFHRLVADKQFCENENENGRRNTIPEMSLAALFTICQAICLLVLRDFISGPPTWFFLFVLKRSISGSFSANWLRNIKRGEGLSFRWPRTKAESRPQSAHFESKKWTHLLFSLSLSLSRCAIEEKPQSHPLPHHPNQCYTFAPFEAHKSRRQVARFLESNSDSIRTRSASDDWWPFFKSRDSCNQENRIEGLSPTGGTWLQT